MQYRIGDEFVEVNDPESYMVITAVIAGDFHISVYYGHVYWGGITMSSEELDDQLAKNLIVPKKSYLLKGDMGCQHTYVTYMGFTHIFDYCSKCDIKK